MEKLISHTTPIDTLQVKTNHAINSDHPFCAYFHSHFARVGIVATVAVAGWAQLRVERYFVTKEAERVDEKIDIAGVRAVVGRIQLGGVDHQVRTVVRLRECRPTRASTYRFPGPYLGDFALAARQSRSLKDS